MKITLIWSHIFYHEKSQDSQVQKTPVTKICNERICMIPVSTLKSHAQLYNQQFALLCEHPGSLLIFQSNSNWKPIDIFIKLLSSIYVLWQVNNEMVWTVLWSNRDVFFSYLFSRVVCDWDKPWGY